MSGHRGMPSDEDFRLMAMTPEKRRAYERQQQRERWAKAPVEYRQLKVRAADGKFHSVLNDNAAQGWEVLSIDRIDELFLVTFQRRRKHRHAEEVPEVATTNSADYAEFADEVARKSRSGWELKHLAAAPVQMHPITVVYYTAVWERETRQQ